MISKRPSTTEGKIVVSFEIPGTIWAESIHLVGDFNNWDRQSLQFQRDRKGDWLIELELEAGREYRFRYLFDNDQWRDDWQADRFESSPDGGFDSIVIAQIPGASPAK